MNDKNSNRLFKKFKFLKKSVMKSGFECEDGWNGLIEEMFLELRALLPPKDFVITKVYDKYGNLGVHSKNGNNNTRSIIQEFCERSEEICGSCGNSKDDEMCDVCKVPEVDYPDEEEENEDNED